MRWPRIRRVLSIALGIGFIAALSPAPATAGVLTATEFGTTNSNRYDWGFETAGSATLSQLTMTVPAGTATTNQALSVSGNAGNYASTPDSPANSITGDIDIRVQATLTDWTPVVPNLLVAKAAGSNSYQFYVNNSGSLVLQTSADGSTWVSSTSSTTPVVSDGQPLWVRAARDVNNGASGSTTRFYTSPDGTTWNQLGTDQINPGITTIINTADGLEVGSNYGGGFNNLDGAIGYAAVHNGINGPVAAAFEPSRATLSTTSWNASTGETWTVNRSGSPTADISANLSVNAVSGIPADGNATLRIIDARVTYVFTPTPVAAGKTITVALGGFTATPTSGAHTSTITTWDAAGTPAAVDTATSGNLVYGKQIMGVDVKVGIEPTLEFIVAGKNSGNCNGATPTGTSSAATMTIAGLIPGAPAITAQDLTVATNAGNGYTLYLRSNGPLSAPGGFTIDDVAGTNLSPAAFPASGEGLGYTTDHVLHNIGDGPTRFQSDKWSRLTATNAEVAFSAAPIAVDATCVAFQVAAAATTEAGRYSATVVYTAVPSY
jgi:hypothetical protein